MVNFLGVMIYISTIIAIVVSGIFFAGIFLGNKNMIDNDTFNVCDAQIKICRISSLVFSSVYWIVVSGKSTKECLEGYSRLSSVCFGIGCVWIAMVFINIVICIARIVYKKKNDGLEIMGRLRKSSLIMGAIFLGISLVLKVD